MKSTVSVVLDDEELERIRFLIDDFNNSTPSGLVWRRSDVIRYAINSLYMMRTIDSCDEV